MKILNLTQYMMKVSGALPIFGTSLLGKCLEIIKFLIILFCPIYVLSSTLIYVVIRSENFILTTTAMYICGGYVIGTSLQLVLFVQSNRTVRLLNKLEALVNERMSASALGERYHETDHNVFLFTKKVGTIWCVIMSFLTSVPFTDGLLQYFLNGSISWNLLYGTSVNPGDMEKPSYALTSIAIQCFGAVVDVYFILTPQFFFVSMCAYFSTLMDDVKSTIQRFDQKSANHKQILFEMVSLHRKSLEFAQDLRELMNGLILIVNTMNMVVMGIVLFQIQETIQRGDYVELPRTLVANFVVMQLMSSFCYLGDKMTTLAAEIFRTICDANWYNYSPKFQMLLIPIIMRTRKPFVMTGYSLVYATLVSLKEMMSFQASAFLLLQKMKG